MKADLIKNIDTHFGDQIQQIHVWVVEWIEYAVARVDCLHNNWRAEVRLAAQRVLALAHFWEPGRQDQIVANVDCTLGLCSIMTFALLLW